MEKTACIVAPPDSATYSLFVLLINRACVNEHLCLIS